MDRFKFRVWDKRYSKYYYDVENTFEENKVLGIDYFGQYLNDDDFIVEQCTGLKDKNGKLIYEGDIIQIKFDSDGIAGPYSVVWDYEEYVFVFKPTEYDYDCDRNLYEFSVNRIKIIGNIHENEDLLEDK